MANGVTQAAALDLAAAGRDPRRRRRIVAVAKRSGAGPKELDQSLIMTVKRGDLAIEVLETGKVQPREKVEIKSKVAGPGGQGVRRRRRPREEGAAPLAARSRRLRAATSRKREADVAAAKNALEFAELSLDAPQERAGGARRGADGRRHRGSRRAGARRWRVQTAEVAYNAAQRSAALHAHRGADGRHGHRARHPAGRGRDAGRAGDVRGQGAARRCRDLSTLIVKADLNQIDVAKVKLGQKVTVTLDALPGKTYDATITKIAPASIAAEGQAGRRVPRRGDAGEGGRGDQAGHDRRRAHPHREEGARAGAAHRGGGEGERQAVRVRRWSPTRRASRRRTRSRSRSARATTARSRSSSGIKEGDKVLIKPASSAENEYKM